MNPKQKHSTQALLTLAFSGFSVVTTEFIIIGILPIIANDLAVSISTAGLLVTVYAFTVAFTAPFLTSFTTKIDRRQLILGTLLLQISTNFLSAITPNYEILLLARIASACSLAIFWSNAAVVAAQLVPENRRGWAISVVFAGISTANLLGIPLGTFIGQIFGWRTTFGTLTGLGLIALGAIARFLPPTPSQSSASLRDRLRLLRRVPILYALAVCVTLMTGNFAAFTYLVPFLEQVTHINGSTSSVMLLLFGVAGIVGNFLGGWAADRHVVRAMLTTMAILVIALLSLYVIGANSGLVVLIILIWGMVHAALFVEVQYRMIAIAPDDPDAASSFNVSIINAGIGSGAALGGFVVDRMGVQAVSWVGAVLVITAIGLLLLSLQNKASQSPQIARQKSF